MIGGIIFGIVAGAATNNLAVGIATAIFWTLVAFAATPRDAY